MAGRYLAGPADQGVASAQYTNLGYLYANGQGVPTERTSKEHAGFGRAARIRGESRAQYSLGCVIRRWGTACLSDFRLRAYVVQLGGGKVLRGMTKTQYSAAAIRWASEENDSAGDCGRAHKFASRVDSRNNRAEN